jgi:hypothetical protein
MEAPEVPTEHLQEEVEHRAKHGGERWTMGVALSSALLAGLAAIGSLKAGHYANEAMMAQIESANQWSYYQSKSIKESQLKSKMELLDALGKSPAEADKAKAAQYAKEKEEIQKKAEATQEEAHTLLHTHELLARSVSMFQIAIAIGAISVLTKRWAFWLVSLGFGILGLFFLAQEWRWMHHLVANQ